jgi:hypothetical protein
MNYNRGIKPSRLSKKLSILGIILSISILISSIIWLLTIWYIPLSSILPSFDTSGYLLEI